MIKRRTTLTFSRGLAMVSAISQQIYWTHQGMGVSVPGEAEREQFHDNFGRRRSAELLPTGLLFLATETHHPSPLKVFP